VTNNPFDTLIQLAEKAANGTLRSEDRSALESAAHELGIGPTPRLTRSSFGFYSDSSRSGSQKFSAFGM
jgi:hypothetical protein